MTATIDIDTTELEERLRRIGSLGSPSVYQEIGFKAARVAGVAAERPLKEVPERRNPAAVNSAKPDGKKHDSLMLQVRGKTFLTDKQRRWFWWAFKSGELKFPYRRSGQLGAPITSAPFAENGMVGFWIGTNRPGAKWVVGPEDEQAMYHRGWWTPLIDGLIAEAPNIARVYEKAFIDEVNRYVRQ